MADTLLIDELTKTMLGNRNIARQNSTASGEEIMLIPLSKLIVRENFNRRIEYGDIEGLGMSILENGQTVPGRVDVLADGTFLLVDGHRRHRALLYLKEQGHEPLFKAIVNSSRTTEEQRIFQMFTTQDNKQLTPNEQANLLTALINLGYKQADIARKIGKPHSYVSQMLAYANESPIIKNHVENGTLSVTAAVKLQKEIPVQSERIKAVDKAVSNKTASKKPVTVTEVTGVTPEDKAEKLACELIETFDLGDSFKAGIINMIKKYY